MKGYNVLGTPLIPCSLDPITGYFRDGTCRTGGGDHGIHCICAQVTEEFLTFSAKKGNDLSTPRPEFEFPGLKPGDSWCLCVMRWKEAFDAGCAPKVKLEATAEAALEFVNLEDLKAHRSS